MAESPNPWKRSPGSNRATPPVTVRMTSRATSSVTRSTRSRSLPWCPRAPCRTGEAAARRSRTARAVRSTSSTSASAIEKANRTSKARSHSGARGRILSNTRRPLATMAMRRGVDRDSTRMSSQVQGVLAATFRIPPSTSVLTTRNATIQRIRAAGACTQGEAAHSPGVMPGSGGIATPPTNVLAGAVIKPESAGLALGGRDLLPPPALDLPQVAPRFERLAQGRVAGGNVGRRGVGDVLVPRPLPFQAVAMLGGDVLQHGQRRRGRPERLHLGHIDLEALADLSRPFVEGRLQGVVPQDQTR